MPIIPLEQLEQQAGSQSNIVPLDQLEQQLSQSAFRSPETAPAGPQKSPLSIIQRLQLSFADDTGREQFLKNKFQIVQRLPNGKFAVGNSAQDIRPIDPAGIFNDVLGDLADVAAIVPPIAGQIIGGAAGFVAAGPAGAIAGGGAGAALGETVSRGIGRLSGVDIRAAEEQAVDIAVSGAFGAVGEGLGQAFKFAGRGLSNVAKRSLDKAIRNSTKPSKALTTLAKVFKVTSAVAEDDVVTAGLYKFNNTIRAPYTNPNYANALATKMVKGVIRRNKALGKLVGVGDDWAKANFGSKSIELRQAGTKLLSGLSDARVGIVDDVGRLSRGAFTESADFRTVKQLTDLFFSKNPRTSQLLPRNLKLSQALDFKKRMGKPLNSYFNSGRANPRAQASIAQYLDDLTKSVAGETTTGGVSAELNPFIKANSRFSLWKKDLELLAENGLDLTDVTDLKKFIRTIDGEQVLLSKSIGDFARKLQDKSFEVRGAFDVIAKQLNVKFPGGGINGTLGTLSDELNKYNAAQGFANASPSFLRLSAIAGMIGASQFVDPTTPAGLAGRGALGLLLGTPAGAALVLKTGEKSLRAIPSNVIKELLKRGKVSPNLLRALISQSVAGRTKKSPNQQ